MRISPAIFSLASLISLSSSLQLTPRASTACNNAVALCSRAYNNITHLGAHDSAFLRNPNTSYTSSGDQYYNATTALGAGVRLLSAQVHNNNGSWDLCHSSCDLLNAGPMTTWLGDIKSWMDTNPNEVVTILIVNSDNASADELNDAFTTAGLADMAYTPQSTSATTNWPTLQSLIDAKTRAMVFIASVDDNSQHPYLMSEFDYIFETNYDITSPSNFSCTANRPASVDGNTAAALSSGLMPFVNHFLYEDVGFGIEETDWSMIDTTNSPSTTTVGALGMQAQTCTDQYGKAPTFFLVDFFDHGPAIQTVDTLNGVSGQTLGRTIVPPGNLNDSSVTGASSPQNGMSAAALVGAIVFAVLGMA